MFRIGEFARIAQVSGRQLRFYDQRGLLPPAHIDPETGYRYYSVRQLPRLNRILALKELGLTLDQIGPLLDEEVSSEKLRAMLTMKRAQVERSLREEEMRLRHIASRIDQIDRDGAIRDVDVVLKSVPALPYLSTRSRCDGMDEAFALLCAVAESAGRMPRDGLTDKLVAVVGPDGEGDSFQLEAGFTVRRPTNIHIPIAGDLELRATELPAEDRMATIVRSGPTYEAHQAFAAIGGWMEANGYEVAGPCREVFLEPITGPPALEDVVVEIQFPVRPAD